MPQDPSDTYVPDIELDDSKKWILKLVEVEERDATGQYAKPGQKTMVFKYNVYDQDDGVAIIDNGNGEMWTLFQFRQDSTFPFNPKTGKIGESREVANALMGRDLTDDEIRDMNAEGWDEALIGRMAIADLEWYTNTKGMQRVRILRMKPYSKPQKAAAAAAATRRPRLDDEEQ